MPPIINKNKCINCKNCVAICPTDVYGLQKKDAVCPEIQYPEECWHCNSCVLECPVKAISLRLPLNQMMVFIDDPNAKRKGRPENGEEGGEGQ